MDFKNIFMSEHKKEESELPLFREYAIDFKTGQNLIDDKTNNIVILEENEALKVWIFKALKTERFRFKEIYSDSYGSELRSNIGTIYQKSVKDALMINQIKDCLLANPYILDCYDFIITNKDETEPHIKFRVKTIYGEIGGVAFEE